MTANIPRPNRPKYRAAPDGLSEEALHRMAGPLLAAAEEARLGVAVSLVKGDEMKRIYINHPAAQMLGYRPEELIGGSTFLTFAPEEVGRIEQLWQQWRAGLAIPYFLETVALRKDGTRVPVEVAYSIVSLDGTEAAIAFLRDISERKRTEAALSASEGLFRKLIEAAPEPVLVMRGLDVVYANPRCLSLIHYDSLEQLLGKSAKLLLHPDEWSAAKDRARLIAESIEPLPPREYRALRSDGSLFWVECSSLAIEYEGGPAILTFVRDITERKEAQAQLIQTDRMATIGTLAAGVAHELNNPLAYLLLNLGLLERELGDLVSDPAEFQRIKARLETVQEGAERMATIVRDLRSFCRPNTKALHPVDVQQLLESAINMATNELKDRARVIRDFSPVPRVVADGARLGQVFLNLLLNAAQALDATERTNHVRSNLVRVGLRMDEGRVLIEVADNGPGIPKDVIDRIFEPFFTTKPAGIGTGLGLSISQAIVTSMQGEITVNSEPGRGATFRVVLPLPLAAPGAASERPAETPEPPAVVRGKRILVVDDEDAIAAAMKKVLEREHEVTAVTSGTEALRLLLESAPFDFVLCDVVMPGLGGIELYRAIEKRRPELLPRFIFMSGASTMPRVAEFFAIIPNERIDKPIDLGLLRAIIQKVEV